jgi:MFS transporter, PAT family, beta-lactamase induction signal transducer AmpG
MTESQRKTWRQSLATYQDRRCITLLLLGFSAGLPLLLIFSSLSLWLREAGVERSTVTMFSWAALFYSFKFIWAPLIDLLPLPVLSRKLGRRRSWLLLAQLLVMLSVVGMASINPINEQQLMFMALFAAALGFSAASQDVVIDAYRIECAGVEMQSALSACYTAGYRIGMIVAGAGALYLATYLGAIEGTYNYSAWQQTYYVMASLFLVGIVTTLMMQEPQAQPTQSHDWRLNEYAQLLGLFLVLVAGFISAYSVLGQWLTVYKTTVLLAFLLETLRFSLALLFCFVLARGVIALRLVNQQLVVGIWLAPIQDFFKRYGKQAFLLLFIIGFYRITDIVAGVISNVFYQDLGFSKNEIATAVKTVGVVLTIFGGFVGGILAQRYALMKVLLLGGLSACLTNLFFVVLSYKGYDLVFLYIAVIADNVTAGLASAVFIAFLSSLTNIRFTAVQYALFSSLMTLFPKLLGGYSGAIVEQVGYANFFIVATLMGLPVLGVVYYLCRNQQMQNL